MGSIGGVLLKISNCINLSKVIHRKQKMYNKKHVATISANGRRKWINLPNIEALKKAIQRTPEKFVEENGNVYLLEVNKKRLNQSLTGALKISGSPYALVLLWTNGEKGKEFYALHSNITNRRFEKHGEAYIKIFEQIIERFGQYVGCKTDDGVNWVETDYKMSQRYKSHPELFYTVNKKIYFLKCVNSAIEEMFFSCVALAGSENALAVHFANGNEKERLRHLMNFKRLGFKHAKTFYEYANLFSDYLSKHRPLFEVNYNEQ